MVANFSREEFQYYVQQIGSEDVGSVQNFSINAATRFLNLKHISAAIFCNLVCSTSIAKSVGVKVGGNVTSRNQKGFKETIHSWKWRCLQEVASVGDTESYLTFCLPETVGVAKSNEHEDVTC